MRHEGIDTQYEHGATTAVRCVCGYEASSWNDLDDHILAMIDAGEMEDIRAEPTHREAK